MTPAFMSAVQIILSHEGGYVKHPRDPGGETNYGISKKAYPDLDIKDLSRNDAQEIYYKDYWKKLRCDGMPFGVALVLFDFGVNAGNRQAVKTMQAVVGTKADGVIGDKTMAAINSLTKAFIIEQFTANRIIYYTKAKGWSAFGRGWVLRSIETMSTALLIRDAI